MADAEKWAGTGDSERESSLSSPCLSHLPPWLERQDIIEADLPYLHDLLASSFRDWLDQADGFPWLPGTIGLYHADGTFVSDGKRQEGRGIPLAFEVPEAVKQALHTCRPTMARADKQDGRDCLAVPVFTRSSGLACAVMVGLLPSASARADDLKLLQSAALHYRSCLYRRFEQMFIGGMLKAQKISRKEASRRDTLFEVLRKLNDHLDVDQVLAELLASLERLYPACRIDLFLSQDYASFNEKVKPLDFHQHGMELCRQAFLDSVVREEQRDDGNWLAVPLFGKQGVYGVLRLVCPKRYFDEMDHRFLSTLAGAAGAAFEKAKLHEQANTLVGELRLINELTKRLNSSLKLSETIQFASSELLNIFQADFCCILQVDSSKNEFVVMTSNVAELIGETYPMEYGFSGVMWNTKEPIILSDYRGASPIPSKLMTVTESRSLLAAPLVLNGEVIGSVLICHREPNYFSYDNYKLLQVLSAHLGLAVSNANLHAEVRRMAVTDHLTGLFARHYLDERITRRQKRDECGSLILMDIDHFKRVNDTYGHQVGDDILQQVSRIIDTSIRDGDIAARWGGEEIAIYLPEVSYDITGRVAERIRRRVEKETNPPVTVSCGLAEWHSNDEKVSVESLFYRADMALYDAKHSGRNRIVIG